MDINYDGDLSKTRTCFWKKSYMFFGKHVHVFTESHDRKQERIWKYTISLPYHQI